ncbi:MFS transporter [Alteromonas sediminis]|uniref:MFS transporter n=1 Tax=Alteromonas sediminis TaxID=2259342 RepID=A0A3N5Y554_9ALTE|nr:MFS transporter [Alteromonas sediminis]RPJ68353.1 MFS transporter [Alteromonas sediminis]
MHRLLIIAAITACYFAFAILLNSVGTVILQSIGSFNISKPEASVLEGFKDLPIAFVSFFIASFIPRMGYKIALIIGLVLSLIGCILVPAVPAFWSIKILFALVGSAFALVKISVYSIVGMLTKSTNEHSALLNTIEGIFMLGVLAGYWYFAYFIDAQNSASLSWLNAYWGLAVLLLGTILLVFISPISTPNKKNDGDSQVSDDFIAMLKLAYKPMVLVFIISIFMYVLVEQGIGTWLPTFNNEVLALPADISVQLTSVFALALALGRLGAGQVLRFLSWFPFMLTCLLGMAALILVSLPLADKIDTANINSVIQLPFIAFLFPLIGAFMAPIYPVLNSVVLSSLPTQNQSAMTGLIVVFSALGGTSGSLITGTLFELIGGQQAFYMLLLPIVGITTALIFLKRWSAHSDVSSSADVEANS